MILIWASLGGNILQYTNILDRIIQEVAETS